MYTSVRIFSRIVLAPNAQQKMLVLADFISTLLQHALSSHFFPMHCLLLLLMQRDVRTHVYLCSQSSGKGRAPQRIVAQPAAAVRRSSSSRRAETVKTINSKDEVVKNVHKRSVWPAKPHGSSPPNGSRRGLLAGASAAECALVGVHAWLAVCGTFGRGWGAGFED